ncbi:MAG: hypothetical protein KatS3mg105_2211 [Gemmatales bacterium]|nr:MAG: hypothetical protein KatS3mg105_2211 [Gemmatales bacterium]
MLLRDYAITPDVFDETSYPHPSTCEAELRGIKDILLEEGLVRDLGDGHWRRLLLSDARPWNRRGKELLKKLVQQNRLMPHVLSGAAMPSDGDDVAWCREAIATNAVSPFTGGIIVTESVKQSFSKEPLVARIDRLSSSPWWSSRSSSVRVQRNLNDYRKNLEPVLRCARSIMIIDPHLDPTQRRYSDVIHLLTAMGGRMPRPLIEVHRVCWFDSRDKRDQHDEAGWQNLFASWTQPLKDCKLQCEVFIWDDFHDRYIISDLVGIGMQNGLDTTAATDLTTWHRLGRDQRDDIQREFDPASGRHKLRHRFTIP